jgi:alkanesulfonate monooxygenase SsuD/methylene tetrahydromethanopterin reductase-like flavin-dependent oxidoreductase (luciferase family)
LTNLKNFGIMLEPQQGMKVSTLVEWSRYAEKLGFGYLFRSDHLLPVNGTRGIDSPECWTTLGLIAGVTTKIRFGPMVSPVGFRNPALLARMACTVHSASGGRLQLGVGAGWYKDEYVAHGLQFPDFRDRKEQFIEALSIIRPLTLGERVDFEGKYFSAHTDCFPKPEEKMRLIVGGRTPAIAKIAASVADEWNVFSSTLESYKALRAAFDSKLDERKVEVSQMGAAHIAENKEGLRKLITERMGLSRPGESYESTVERLKARGVIVGLIDDFVEQIGERMDAGIEKFYFQFLDPTNRVLAELLANTIKNQL